MNELPYPDRTVATNASSSQNGVGSYFIRPHPNKYRFYHCYQKPSIIVCYPVDNESIPPSEPNSRLLFVSKYVPQVFDSLILNYKYHRNVTIVRSIGITNR